MNVLPLQSFVSVINRALCASTAFIQGLARAEPMCSLCHTQLKLRFRMEIGIMKVNAGLLTGSLVVGAADRSWWASSSKTAVRVVHSRASRLSKRCTCMLVVFVGAH